MNRIFILTLLLLTVSCPLIAQDVGSISGDVTDPDGEPITEARVLMVAAGQVPLIAETGDGGLFAFEDAAAVEWTIIVSKIGYFNFRDTVAVEADEELELEIELRPVREPIDNGSISGGVTDPDGEPLTEARIIMVAAGQVPLSAETGDDGLFAFEEAAAVEWTIIVSKSGYFNFRDTVAVEADEELELEIELRPVREPVDYGSISGDVTDPEGEPLSEARITMVAVGQVPLRAETGDDGLFAFEEAAAVEWTVIVSKIGYFNFRDTVAVEADEEMELEIELRPIREEVETGSISGIVFNTDGEPIALARILMVAVGQVPLRAETGDDGMFAFEEAAAVEWDLIVSARGFFNFRDDIVVEADQEVELEIQLEFIGGDDGEGGDGGPDGVMREVLHYSPYQNVLSIPLDTPQEFEIFPFDPEEARLSYLWKFDGNYVDDFTWLLIVFGEIRKYQVTVYIFDETLADSITWEIIVGPTSVPRKSNDGLPSVPVLYSAAPNPFNSTTSISYLLPIASNISLDLYNLSGQLVNSMYKGYKQAGVYSVTISADNLPSGLYFISLKASDKVLTRKIMLIR